MVSSAHPAKPLPPCLAPRRSPSRVKEVGGASFAAAAPAELSTAFRGPGASEEESSIADATPLGRLSARPDAVWSGNVAGTGSGCHSHSSLYVPSSHSKSAQALSSSSRSLRRLPSVHLLSVQEDSAEHNEHTNFSSTEPRLEHTSSTLSDFTHASPEALQQLAGALMVASASASREDAQNLQHLVAAVGAAVHANIAAKTPEYSLATALTSSNSAQSGVKHEPRYLAGTGAALLQLGLATSHSEPPPPSRSQHSPPIALASDKKAGLGSHVRGFDDEELAAWPKTRSTRQAAPSPLWRHRDASQIASGSDSFAGLPRFSETRLGSAPPTLSSAEPAKASRPQNTNFRVYSNTFQDQQAPPPHSQSFSKQARIRDVRGRDVRWKQEEPSFASADTWVSQCANPAKAHGQPVQGSSQFAPATDAAQSMAEATRFALGNTPGEAAYSLGYSIANGTNNMMVPPSSLTAEQPWSAFSAPPGVPPSDTVASWMQLQALMQAMSRAPGGGSALASMIPKSSPFASLEAWRTNFMLPNTEALPVSIPQQRGMQLPTQPLGFVKPLAGVAPEQDAAARPGQAGQLPVGALRQQPSALSANSPFPGPLSGQTSDPNLATRVVRASDMEEHMQILSPSYLLQKNDDEPSDRASDQPGRLTMPDPHNPFELHRHRMAYEEQARSTPTVALAEKQSVTSTAHLNSREHESSIREQGSAGLDSLVASVPPPTASVRPEAPQVAVTRAATVCRPEDDAKLDRAADQQAAETLLSLVEPMSSSPTHPRLPSWQAPRRPRSHRVLAPKLGPARAAPADLINDSSGNSDRQCSPEGSSEERSGPPSWKLVDRKRKANQEDEAWVPRTQPRKQYGTYD